MNNNSLQLCLNGALVASVTALVLTGCGAAPAAPASIPQARPPQFATPETTEKPIDLGDNWADVEGVLSGGPSPATTSAPAPSQARPWSSKPRHALVLQTFSEDLNGAIAKAYIEQLGTLLPEHRARLHTHIDRHGSMALYGNYDGWDDPTAPTDADVLADIQINGKRLFGPIIRTDIEQARTPEEYSDLELISIWTRYPKVRAIYALEIELWGDFESDQWPADRRRSKAMERVAQLRQRGFDAYCHHDERRELSTVTVGLFSEAAINPQSGIADPDLARLQKEFPIRLINGEELRMPVQRGGSAQNVQPIRSRLIKVPRP